MNKDIETMIQAQQEYTYLQKLLKSENFNKSFIMNKNTYAFAKTEHIKIVRNKLRAILHERKVKLIWNIIGAVMFASVLIFGLLFCLSIISPTDETSESDSYPSYSTAAQQAIEDGDYETAHMYLDKGLEEYPQGFAFYYVYADLYEAEGKYDDAVYILMEGIEKCGGMEFVQSTDNLMYSRLLNYEYPISDKARADVDEFIKECDHWIIQYQLASQEENEVNSLD